jgi:hypothetical protein
MLKAAAASLGPILIAREIFPMTYAMMGGIIGLQRADAAVPARAAVA